MAETDDHNQDKRRPVIIDISLRNQIRKERIVAAVLAVLVAGLAYIIFVNLH